MSPDEILRRLALAMAMSAVLFGALTSFTPAVITTAVGSLLFGLLLAGYEAKTGPKP
jgi:hypothetical protein